MTGIPSYSTTPANNVAAKTGITWDEGMSPALVNNSARQNMTDTRLQWNDASWFQYGAGSEITTTAPAYASGTTFTIAGIDVTAYWHVGRRVKAVGSGTGTIYGKISATAFSTNTTVTVVWDSGSLSNETLTIYAGTQQVTGQPVPLTSIGNFGTGVATLLGGTSSGTGGPAGTISPTFTGTITGASATLSGTLLAGTGTSGGGSHALATAASGQNVLYMSQSHASVPFGPYVDYTGSAPNGTGNEFLTCHDTSAVRATIRSNGGLANFSANNVNLSDINTKPEFVVLKDDELDRLESAYTSVDWAKYKYHDQTHDDWNYGPSAQGVEKAFAEVNPTIVDVWNPTTREIVGYTEPKEGDENGPQPIYREVETPKAQQLKCYYTHDMENISHALLARALKRISALERS